MKSNVVHIICKNICQLPKTKELLKTNSNYAQDLTTGAKDGFSPLFINELTSSKHEWNKKSLFLFMSKVTEGHI